MQRDDKNGKEQTGRAAPSALDVRDERSSAMGIHNNAKQAHLIGKRTSMAWHIIAVVVI